MFNFRNRKMIKTLNNISFPFSARFPGVICHGVPQEYVSPNGKYRAYVMPVQNPGNGKDESEIIITSKDGNILFQKSYTAKSDESGLFVLKAAWSADSRFFVYSMVDPCAWQFRHFPTFFISTDKVPRKVDPKHFAYNLSDSCGHRSWHFPAFSLLTDNFEAKSLDDRIGFVVNPIFRLSAPDIIRITAISKAIKDQWYFEVSLSDLAKR